jgi:hypothetical protein
MQKMNVVGVEFLCAKNIAGQGKDSCDGDWSGTG